MRARGTAVAATLALLATAATVGAQTIKDVPVRVTAVSGREVYLDKGRSHGLQPGDIVVLRPRGAATAKATILDVSRKQSRAVLEKQLATVAIGDVGNVRVPESRLAQVKSQQQPGKVADHPPWTGQIPWNSQDLPLLAPTGSRGPRSRPPSLSGRAWFRATLNNNEYNGDNEYQHYDTGADLTISNPFLQGGELHARGVLIKREQELQYIGNYNYEETRVDRLSYRFGHASDSGVRFQIGRFLQTFSPYLGLVDGAELDIRIGDSTRIGASFGGFPALVPDTPQFELDDKQATVFLRSRGEGLQYGIGYQKTWHNDQSDRDLALLDVFWAPSKDVAIRGDLWVDYYDEQAVYKDEGFEVTELRGSLNWTIDAFNGLALDYNYFVWPELLRHEFRQVEPVSIRGDYVHRATLRTWHILSSGVRFDLRAAPWKDQNDTGIGGNARVTLSTPARGLYLALDAFRSDGSFERAIGGRATIGSQGSLGAIALSYEKTFNDYDREPIVDTVFNQVFAGSLDLHAFSAFDLSLTGEYRDGETTNSYTATLYFQTRF